MVEIDLFTLGNQAFDIGSRSFSSGTEVRFNAANNLIQAQVLGENTILEIESSVDFSSLFTNDFIR